MPLRSRRRDAGVLSPNLTPLLDVVLQLITFFMILIHFGTKIEGATEQVRLPVAAAALPGSELAFDRLAVAIDADGRLLDGDRPIDDEAAKTWWADQAARRRAGLAILGAAPAPKPAGRPDGPGTTMPTLVVIRADRRATYGAVRRALLAAQGEGFADFSLMVLKEEEPGR